MYQQTKLNQTKSKPNQTKLNQIQTKPNQVKTKPNQVKTKLNQNKPNPNQTKPNQTYIEAVNSFYFISPVNEISIQEIEHEKNFLSLRVFGQLYLSLLLIPQRFGRYILRPFEVFVELGNLHGTSNYVLYWIYGGHMFWFR